MILRDGRLLRCAFVGVLVLVWAHVATAQKQESIVPANTSRHLSNDRWAWTIFLKASSDILSTIRCVRYTLHETFPKPVNDVCTMGRADQAFSLSGEGWGVFEVRIQITFNDGRTRGLRHMLQFALPQPPTESLSVDNVSRQVKSGWWEWEVFVKGPESLLSQIKCVEYTLHPTFPNPVQRVCTRGTGPRAFALKSSGWGTFQIRVKVLMKNGNTVDLKHDLSFTG
jgi:transcription initiation factor IIF auxiliary subunit